MNERTGQKTGEQLLFTKLCTMAFAQYKSLTQQKLRSFRNVRLSAEAFSTTMATQYYPYLNHSSGNVPFKSIIIDRQRYKWRCVTMTQWSEALKLQNILSTERSPMSKR